MSHHDTKPHNIAILGGGSWGTALAQAQASAGHSVRLWSNNMNIVETINQTRINTKYLPGISLHENIVATTDMQAAINNCAIALIVIPAQAIKQVLDQYRQIINGVQSVLFCAKGIDQNTGLFACQTAQHYFEPQKIGVLSGPSFAADVVRGLPTAVVLACDQLEESTRLAKILSSKQFRIYASNDLMGVELGGALKNVLALAVGIARGLNLGASAEAALITRGFGEMQRIAVRIGAKPETLTGLSGLGDLILTASSTQSRNFSYGIALGEGASTEDLPLAEGVYSAKMAAQLARQLEVDTPIINGIAKIVEGTQTPSQTVKNLMERPLKAE